MRMSNREKHIEWRKKTLIERRNDRSCFEDIRGNLDRELYLKYCEIERDKYIYRLEVMSNDQYNRLRKQVIDRTSIVQNIEREIQETMNVDGFRVYRPFIDENRHLTKEEYTYHLIERLTDLYGEYEWENRIINKKFYWNDEENRFMYDVVIWDKVYYG